MYSQELQILLVMPPIDVNLSESQQVPGVVFDQRGDVLLPKLAVLSL